MHTKEKSRKASGDIVAGTREHLHNSTFFPFLKTDFLCILAIPALHDLKAQVITFNLNRTADFPQKNYIFGFGKEIHPNCID